MRKTYPSASLTLLFFDYGQRCVKQERRCSRRCALTIRAEWKEIFLPNVESISKNIVASSSLKDTARESKHWYVPFRNTIFIAHAFSYVESLALRDKKRTFEIVLGFKCEGKESYPDTTSRYIKVMNVLARTAAPLLNIKIVAPFIKKDKEDIIVLGMKLEVDYRDTWSCYVSGKRQCGECLACRLRKAGFYWAGMQDPTSYLQK
jgi:7-cyano-7-deazaguanine synthase